MYSYTKIFGTLMHFKWYLLCLFNNIQFDENCKILFGNRFKFYFKNLTNKNVQNNKITRKFRFGQRTLSRSRLRKNNRI